MYLFRAGLALNERGSAPAGLTSTSLSTISALAIANSQAVDAKIAEINSRLDEAVVVVPEFPSITVLILSLVMISAMFARYRGLGKLT